MMIRLDVRTTPNRQGYLSDMIVVQHDVQAHLVPKFLGAANTVYYLPLNLVAGKGCCLVLLEGRCCLYHLHLPVDPGVEIGLRWGWMGLEWQVWRLLSSI